MGFIEFNVNNYRFMSLSDAIGKCI